MLLTCAYAYSQPYRDPANYRGVANYIVDDDVIVVPVEYDERLKNTLFNFKYPRLNTMKAKVDYWVQRDIYLENWGLHDDGIFTGPSQAEKDHLYQKELLRYFTRAAGDPLKEDLRSWWDSKREANIEKQSKAIQERNDDVVGDIIDGALEKRGLSKKGKVSNFNYKVKFRPRPLRKFLDIFVESDYAELRIRYNNGGEMEYLLDQRYSKLGLYWLVEYEAFSKDYEIVIDKKLIGNFGLRLSQNYTELQTEANIAEGVDRIERRAHLRYSQSF